MLTLLTLLTVLIFSNMDNLGIPVDSEVIQYQKRDLILIMALRDASASKKKEITWSVVIISCITVVSSFPSCPLSPATLSFNRSVKWGAQLKKITHIENLSVRRYRIERELLIEHGNYYLKSDSRMLIGHTEGNKGLVRIVVKNRKPSVKVITSSPQVIYVQIPKKVFFSL